MEQTLLESEEFGFMPAIMNIRPIEIQALACGANINGLICSLLQYLLYP